MFVKEYRIVLIFLISRTNLRDISISVFLTKLAKLLVASHLVPSGTFNFGTNLF